MLAVKLVQRLIRVVQLFCCRGHVRTCNLYSLFQIAWTLYFHHVQAVVCARSVGPVQARSLVSWERVVALTCSVFQTCQLLLLTGFTTWRCGRYTVCRQLDDGDVKISTRETNLFPNSSFGNSFPSSGSDPAVISQNNIKVFALSRLMNVKLRVFYTGFTHNSYAKGT